MTVSTRRIQSVGAMVALAVAAAAPATGQGWRSPAAGPSMTGDPEVVLTFDDGPNPATTPKVLDALKAHHLKAIFFLVGDRLRDDNPQARALVARMLREGHVIGTHTMSHLDLCLTKPEQAASEVDDAIALITSISGMKAPYFRAPYGAYCKRVADMLEERRLIHFYWDIDSQEWKHGSAKRATAYITRALGRLQGRAVLLMHDTKVATAKALPVILDWLVAENKVRAESTRRQIRVLTPSELAAEQMAPGLIDWLRQVGAAGVDAAAAAAACLP